MHDTKMKRVGERKKLDLEAYKGKNERYHKRGICDERRCPSKRNKEGDVRVPQWRFPEGGRGKPRTTLRKGKKRSGGQRARRGDLLGKDPPTRQIRIWERTDGERKKRDGDSRKTLNFWEKKVGHRRRERKTARKESWDNDRASTPVPKKKARIEVLLPRVRGGGGRVTSKSKGMRGREPRERVIKEREFFGGPSSTKGYAGKGRESIGKILETSSRKKGSERATTTKRRTYTTKKRIIQKGEVSEGKGTVRGGEEKKEKPAPTQ